MLFSGTWMPRNKTLQNRKKTSQQPEQSVAAGGTIRCNGGTICCSRQVRMGFPASPEPAQKKKRGKLIQKRFRVTNGTVIRKDSGFHTGGFMAERKKKTNYIVVKDNELIMSYTDPMELKAHRLTLEQRKCFDFCVSRIRQDDPPDTHYTVHISEIYEALGRDRSKTRVYDRRFNDDLNALEQRYTLYIEAEKAFVSASYLGDHRFSGGYLEYWFNPNLAPYLFGLKRNFTQVPIHQLTIFGSNYGYILYQKLRQKISREDLWMCKKFEKHVSIDTLRNWLEVGDSLKNWNTFELRAVRPAVEEINRLSTEIHVDYLLTRGAHNRVSEVIFLIETASTQQRESAQALLKEFAP